MAFAYLESVADADEYQGRNVTDAWIEEAGQYPTPAPIDRLFGVLRSTHDVQSDPSMNPATAPCIRGARTADPFRRRKRRVAVRRAR
jgi:hypothetical protein